MPMYPEMQCLQTLAHGVLPFKLPLWKRMPKPGHAEAACAKNTVGIHKDMQVKSQ